MIFVYIKIFIDILVCIVFAKYKIDFLLGINVFLTIITISIISHINVFVSHCIFLSSILFIIIPVLLKYKLIKNYLYYYILFFILVVYSASAFIIPEKEYRIVYLSVKRINYFNNFNILLGILFVFYFYILLKGLFFIHLKEKLEFSFKEKLLYFYSTLIFSTMILNSIIFISLTPIFYFINFIS